MQVITAYKGFTAVMNELEDGLMFGIATRRAKTSTERCSQESKIID